MTSNWRLTSARYQAREQLAAEMARTVRIEHEPDGTISIVMPALAKLIDPLNTCLCPACLLPKL